MDRAAADRAVVVHLVHLIQDSPDVRYFVGGPFTKMRELLVKAIEAGCFEGDPLDALKPAPHHAHEEPRFKRLERDVSRLESGLDEVRLQLLRGRDADALAMLDRLQAGGYATEESERDRG